MSRRRTLALFLTAALLLAGAVVAYLAWQARSQVNPVGVLGEGTEAQVSVPDDFTVNVFAAGLSGPRFISLGPDNVLYVADRGNGRIVALPDADGDGRADAVRPFATDLNAPHSLAYHAGAWYVGVPTGVVRLVDGDGDGIAEQRQVIIDDYPRGGHNTRTVTFLSDGRLVVSIGSSCNVCTEEDPRRAAIVVYDDPAGQDRASAETLYATGLRNAVGLAVHPLTGALWATNNGRDMMGDDSPPETVYIVQPGVNYGWPVCHSGRIVDPDMGFRGACDGVAAPLVEMQAHSAPLGLAFYTGDSFPPDYQGDLFIAFHGSWNRSIPTGYKVVRLPLEGSRPEGPVTDFAAGWLDLEANVVSGRPVGLAVGADGALYVTDDKGGFVYRIQYAGRG